MKAIITGGAGFVGCNAAARLIREGHSVVVLDNLSRAGSEKNLNWLQSVGDFEFIKVDLRQEQLLNHTIGLHSDADMILHLAGQVAVTTSVDNPRLDVETNLMGTFNLLEAVRTTGNRPFFIFASTNKVYGKMDDLLIKDFGDRYGYVDGNGVSEQRPLDFYSPYGCSKGAADQYVRDYARIYGLPSCVFRMSCIYGPRQFGIEDQGWVAWFIIAAVLERQITIFGDGKQVRDILYVDDLIDLYLAAYENRKSSAGKVYNAGGGISNTLSLKELLAHIEKRLDKKIEVKTDDWRPGDQKVYISDTTLAESELGWSPKFDRERGVDTLIDWVVQNKGLFE